MTRFPNPYRLPDRGNDQETLYLLGEGDRVVGVSGYTVRPPEAREKPKVSAFISAKFDKIEDLNPDLVLAFSDLQADLCAELVKRGMNVVTFNQRKRRRDSADDSDAGRPGRMPGQRRKRLPRSSNAVSMTFARRPGAFRSGRERFSKSGTIR